MEPKANTDPAGASEVDLSSTTPSQRELVNDEDLLSPHAQETIGRLASGLGVLLVVALFFANLRRLSPPSGRVAKVGEEKRATSLATRIASSPYGREGQGS